MKRQHLFASIAIIPAVAAHVAHHDAFGGDLNTYYTSVVEDQDQANVLPAWSASLSFPYPLSDLQSEDLDSEESGWSHNGSSDRGSGAYTLTAALQTVSPQQDMSTRDPGLTSTSPGYEHFLGQYKQALSRSHSLPQRSKNTQTWNVGKPLERDGLVRIRHARARPSFANSILKRSAKIHEEDSHFSRLSTQLKEIKIETSPPNTPKVLGGKRVPKTPFGTPETGTPKSTPPNTPPSPFHQANKGPQVGRGYEQLKEIKVETTPPNTPKPKLKKQPKTTFQTAKEQVQKAVVRNPSTLTSTSGTFGAVTGLMGLMSGNHDLALAGATIGCLGLACQAGIEWHRGLEEAAKHREGKDTKTKTSKGKKKPKGQQSSLVKTSPPRRQTSKGPRRSAKAKTSVV